MSTLVSHILPQANLSVDVARTSILVGLVTSYFAWRERGQQRRLLRRLDDRMLKDIGLSRSDVG